VTKKSREVIGFYLFVDSVPSTETSSSIQNKDDTPVIIILVVCVVGIFLLALNIGLILFFVRRRKKRLESKSDVKQWQ